MLKNRYSKISVSVMLTMTILLSLFAVYKIVPGAQAEQRSDDLNNTTGQQETVNEAAVTEVITAINNIGNVEFTSECYARINAARTAYENLNGREKQHVRNYSRLSDAENAFNRLSKGRCTAVRFIVNGAVDGVFDTHANRVYFGNYDQQGDTDPEPVLWRILDHSDGRMLLLSDKILAVKAYHISSAVSIPWTSCSLRTWLNGNGEAVAGATDDSFFNNAFSAAEQTAVRDTNVSEILSSGGAGQGTIGLENPDKVFILSSAEVMNTAFGFTDSTAATDTRAAQSTSIAHAAAQGSGIDRSWWLRDTDAGTSRWVHNDGQAVASSDTGTYNQSDLRGIRPALFINLSQVLFASPALSGKNADGAFAKIPEYTGKEWKLTVRNNSYRFSVSETAATAERGETVTLNYTKAKYGEKDRISAILVNADGNPVYYGQIAQPTAAAGSVDITVPQDIIPGNYTLRVFNEQLNGDYATDYASAFCDVALTIPCRHDWKISVTGSCETSITRDYTCRICGETYTETEDGSGSHTWEDYSWEGSDEDGWTIYYRCTVCDARTTETIPGEFRQQKAVIAKINAIGQVEYTAECLARITEARTAYTELPDRFKPGVTNYNILTEAEETYAALAQAAENTTQPEETTRTEETTQPEDTTEPSENTTQPEGTTGHSDEGEDEDLCKWCGRAHVGFFEKILGFFHGILYFFAHLFGRR